METFLLVLHIILSFTIVVVILLQSGQGGGLGAGFSSAAAMGQEVFGGRGAAGFLEKTTVVLGTMFMVTSMALAWYSSKPQSALDLDEVAEDPIDSQVHQIIDEGNPDIQLDEVEDEMPQGAEPAPLLDDGTMDPPDDDGNLQINLGDEDGEGSIEDLQQQLEGEIEGGEIELETGDDVEQPIQPIEEPAGEE